MMLLQRNVYLEQIMLYLQDNGLTVTYVDENKKVSEDACRQMSAAFNMGVYDLAELNALIDGLAYINETYAVSVTKFYISPYGNLLCGTLSITCTAYMLVREQVTVTIFPDLDLAMSEKLGEKVSAYPFLKFRIYRFLKMLSRKLLP